MNDLRARFVKETCWKDAPVLLVTAVKLPSGAIETITNHELLHTKINDLMERYDDAFRLKANTSVQIVGYMLI